MVEILTGWLVWPVLGLLVCGHTIWWLHPARKSLSRPERVNAWGHTIKMALAFTVHVGTLVAGKLLVESVLDAPMGWNWSVTTEGTLRGIVIFYVVLWAQIVLTLNAIILRITWKLSEEAQVAQELSAAAAARVVVTAKDAHEAAVIVEIKAAQAVVSAEGEVTRANEASE